MDQYVAPLVGAPLAELASCLCEALTTRAVIRRADEAGGAPPRRRLDRDGE